VFQLSGYLPLFLGTSEIDLSSPLNYGTPSSRLGIQGTPRTPGGTPMRMRVDIGSTGKLRQVNLGSDATGMVSNLCPVVQKKLFH
jgi:DNA replication licensing factor MCM4